VRLLEGVAVDITPPEGERLGLPSWLPFAIDSIGITFPGAVVDDGELQVPPTGTTLTPDLLDGLRLRVSGGLAATDQWPITAAVDGLEVDLGLLAAGQPPITNLDAIRFGVEPFELPGGAVVGGVLELGSVPVNGETVVYGRVVGELSVNGIGGGAELVVSQWGPLLLRISAPLGIPLGPTGLILAGATGAAQFGDVGVTVPPAGDPLALLSNAMDLPTDVVIDRDRIIAELSTVDEGEYTWDQGFALALAGDLTVAAAPGILQGRVSIGFNLGLPEGPDDPPGLQLVGKGEVTVHGIPLGEAGLLFDVTDPIEPTYDFAFASPVPGSPLALIVPAQATLGIGLRTDGVVLGTAEGLRVFVTELAAGALTEGQSLFEAVLDEVAAGLDTRRARPLARLLLDVDGNGSVSGAEDGRAITGAFVVDRLLGRNGLAPLLPATVAPGAEDDVAAVVGAVLDELLLVAADVLADPAAVASFGLDPTAALAALADVVRDATADALAALGDRFDPSVTVEGALQPSILGIAFGDPTVQGALSIDRRGLFFELGGSIVDATKLTLSQTFPPAASLISAAITAGTLGLSDQLAVGMRLPYGGVIDALIDGDTLPQFQPLDPEWALSLEGGLALFGFEVGELSGLAVLPGQATFLGTQLQIADDPAAWIDRTKTPVTQARFDDLVDYGGLLITGSLRVPQLLTRPGDLLASLPPPPSDPFAYGAWLQDLAALSTSVDTPARVQLYLPGTTAITDGDTAVEVLGRIGIEGVWNGDVLGLDLGAGRVTAGAGGVGVTGVLPLTGGTATATLNTRVLDTVAGDPSCPPPTIPPTGEPCLPTGSVDVTLTNAEVVRALAELGVPSALVPESSGRLRAATPGFDEDATDPLLRNGGIEIEAQLRSALFGSTGFRFAVTPRSGGYDVRATARADVGPIAGVSLDDAEVTVQVVGGVPNVGVRGTATVLGARATIDGTLAGDLTGSLEVRFDSGSPPMDLAGLTMQGSTVLTLTRDTKGILQGSLGVRGRATLPSWLATASGTAIVDAAACVDTEGDAEVHLALPAMTIGPRGLVQIGRNASQAALPAGPAACTLPAGAPAQLTTGPLVAWRVASRVPSLVVDGSLALLASGAGIAGLSVQGSFDGTRGTGSLAVSFAGGEIDLSGFEVTGSAELDLTATSVTIAVDGSMSVPGLLGSATVTGTGDETGITLLQVTGAALQLPVVNVDSATLELRRTSGVYRLAANVQVDVPGVATNLAASGSFTSNGNGSLSLSATSLTVGPAQITDGSFSLVKTGSAISLRAGGRYTLFGVGLEVVQADLTLSASGPSGSLVIRPVGGGTLSLGGWTIGGTLRLSFTGSSATIEIDNGTVTIPGWGGTVGMDGSISVPPVNGASFTLALPSGGLRLGPTGSPFFGTGTYQLAFSGNVGTLSVTNGGLQWRAGTTVLASVTVPSLSISTNGAVSASLSSFSASAGGFSFTVPSLSFLLDPSGLNARLSLGTGSVTFPGIGTFSTPSFAIGTVSTFSVVLVDSELDLGLLDISGRLTFQREGGVFRLRLDDVRNSVGVIVRSPELDLAGLATIPLPTFFIASDGTFALDVGVPTIGPSGFQIVGASMSLSKSGTSLTTLAGELVGGRLLIGNAEPIVLPALEFDFNSRFDESFTIPALELGPFLRSDEVDLRVRNVSDGTIRLTLQDDTTISVLAGTTKLTLNELDARSDGTMTGSVSGRVELFGTKLASATLDLSRDGTRFRLTLPSSRAAELDLGFLEASLSGFLRSDGSFSFTGSTSVYAGITGFNLSGSVSLTVASSGISGSFAGQVCFVVCGGTTGTLRSDGRIRGFLEVDANDDGDYRDFGDVYAEYRVYLASGAVLVDDRDDDTWDIYWGDPTNDDETPPSMTTPPNITVSANIGSSGRVRVYYTPPTASDGGDPIPVRCSPAPGSEFTVGTTTVTCTATDLNGNVRTKTFTVTIVADSAAVVPSAPTGTTVVVTASGFAANSWAYVSVNSDPTPIGVFQADAQGRITLTLTIPDGLPPGEHTIVVEGFGPDGSVRQFVQPIVVPAAGPAPTTTAAPRVGLPGTGADSSGGLAVAVLVTLAGLAVLAATRRRPT
jgi:hypothetical protein